MPFCLLSKKRYVGIKYETDPNKGKRNEMGIVLKRRDNAPIVKDVYGGVIDILMKECNVQNAIEYVYKCLQDLVDGHVEPMKLDAHNVAWTQKKITEDFFNKMSG